MGLILNRDNKRDQAEQAELKLSNRGGGGVKAINGLGNGRSSPQPNHSNSASSSKPNPLSQARTLARQLLTKIHKANRPPTKQESEYLARLAKGDLSPLEETPLDQIALTISESIPLPRDFLLPIGNQAQLEEQRYSKLIELYKNHYTHTNAISLLSRVKPNTPEIEKLKKARDQIQNEIKQNRLARRD